QHGADSNGHGLTPDEESADRGQASGPPAGAASRDEDRAPDGPADDDVGLGDTAVLQLPPELTHRPAGFATGSIGPDPQAHSGEDPPGRGEGASYEPGDEAAGSGWVPDETSRSGVRAFPYPPHGDAYDPYPRP